jgi:hypothetical protein
MACMHVGEVNFFQGVQNFDLPYRQAVDGLQA